MDKTLFSLRALVALCIAGVIHLFVSILRAFQSHLPDMTRPPDPGAGRVPFAGITQSRARAFLARCQLHSQFHAGGFDALYHSV